MSAAGVDAVVRAVLYEGYVLYPYRASSIKNRHRFTFGTLYPDAWCQRNEGDASSMQTECIVHVHDTALLDVTVRFLQLVDRIDGEVTRQEAVERMVELGSDLATSSRTRSFSFDDLNGEVVVSSEPVGDELRRVRVVIRNVTSSLHATTRDEALASSFVSTHTLIGLKNGDFVSSFDPPADLKTLVEACKNVGTWPVLIGSDGARDAVLSSPVVLYDYPSVAPESPGDLFDATEIDEILTLRILTMTDAEKEEARKTDPRAAALIERTLSLGARELASLHGTLRAKRRCGAGDRVRLRPEARSGRGGDIFDLALVGKTATIQSVEQDFEGRTFFAVVVDDDPGRDLGIAGQPGHRFFFRPEEVELLVKRILVAGVGNMFLGDDGFGVAVVQELAKRTQPSGVDVVDFGIRGVDLTFALMGDYDAAILVDTAQRGGPPGSLYVIEPKAAENADPQAISSDPHGVHPARALALVSALGGKLGSMRLVACEPKVMSEDDPDLTVGLSPEVAAAVQPAIDLVEELLLELCEREVARA